MTDDTQSVSFNILHHLRVKSLVEESIQEPIRSIGAILKSKSFKTEYFIAQSVGLKIATRLRSSRITVVCSQFLKNLHLFCDQKVAFVILPLNLLVEEQLDTRSGNVLIPSNDVMVNILETLSKGCAYLCQAIHYSTFLFADSVMWLKLGHMNQHILPLMSAVSRLSIMCRAIVVYCCDLYKGVHQLLTRLKASHVKVCLYYVESLLPLIVSYSSLQKTAPSIDHFLESFSNLPPSTMETDVEPPLPMVCETPAKPSNRTPKPDTLEDIGGNERKSELLNLYLIIIVLSSLCFQISLFKSDNEIEREEENNGRQNTCEEKVTKEESEGSNTGEKS